MMDATFNTPQNLVEGLQTRQAGARALLWRLLREPVERLMGELIQRTGLEQDRDLLTAHALHSAETALRAKPPAAFATATWNAFRASILLQIARIIAAPHGGSGAGASSGPPPLPEAPDYHSDTFFRPYTQVGDHFFGGDWYAGRTHEDSLWVFVADVTGHGYFAYLLATALPAVWQHCWNQRPGRVPQPAELLAAMHHQLADSLPEGIFLECTLVRLDSRGHAVVSPAGGTRLLIRRERGIPELVKLRGAWLGLAAPSTEDQYRLDLSPGDELVLATDGAFDQLDEEGGMESMASEFRGRTLFDDFRSRLEESLAREPQKDDITLVLLRRRDISETPVLVKFPGSGPEADDVPV